MMETPPAKHDSCNPARRLTCSELKPCCATLFRREKTGSTERGEPEDVINICLVVAFSPSLTTAIIFRHKLRIP